MLAAPGSNAERRMATMSSRSSDAMSISVKAVLPFSEIAQAKPAGIAKICGDQRFARGQGCPGLLQGGGLRVDQPGVVGKAALYLVHGLGAIAARLVDIGAKFGDGFRVLLLLGRVQGLGQKAFKAPMFLRPSCSARTRLASSVFPATARAPDAASAFCTTLPRADSAMRKASVNGSTGILVPELLRSAAGRDRIPAPVGG